MKQHIQLLVAVLLSFALGWTSNGYRIYSGMFDYTMNKSAGTANDLIEGLKQ